MRITALALLLVIQASISAGAFADEPNADSSDSDWKLAWQDEFDEEQLSPEKWNVLLREHSKHNERQYYVPDEAYIHEDCLRLRSRVRDFGSQHYTSGRVDTSGKFAAVYGRFDVKAKLPKGQGLWPAHWLYPQKRDWAMERLMAEAVAKNEERLIPEERPWYTEIDIMEFLGHEPKVVYGTLHYHSFQGEKKSSSGKLEAETDLTEAFHVYRLEWEPDEIRWYVDDSLIHSTKEGIPHAPHYLILNTAVGGAWPGDPNDTTVFPQYHDIDYVRVYQKEDYFKEK